MKPPCEDFPCCGHGYDQYGNPDCPDSKGRFTCVGCGKRLKKSAASSICPKCQTKMRNDDWDDDYNSEGQPWNWNY